MSRSNFRVKVDLSKFYNDARRFCWVFVDGTKILQISHMKQHVSKLLNIKEPFHLLLNDAEYLPPTEDVRILKESETVVVVPGSGLDNEADSLYNDSLFQDLSQTPRIIHDCQAQNRINASTQDKGAQTVEMPVTKVELVTSNQPEMSSNVLNGSQPDMSGIDISFHTAMEDKTIDSVSESKMTDSNTTEDYSMLDMSLTPTVKPKRTRKRKTKHHGQQQQQQPNLITNVKEEETKSKKPKIIDSMIISSGKHIRFEGGDNEDSNNSQQSVQDVTANGSVNNKPSCSKQLATLLALRQCSTPLTFANKKVKDEVKMENVSSDEVKIVSAGKQMRDMNGTIRDDKKLTDLDLDRVPVMISKAQVNDIIAFKMLKIGADYTPQVSKFIIAEVLSCCPKTSIYTLKIIKGADELQVPIGKYSLPEQETETVVDDTISINYTQIIEPRLLRQSRPEIASTI